jgi:hypothetical protein
VDEIRLAQVEGKWLAAVNAVMNLLVPYNVGDLLTSWGTIGF